MLHNILLADALSAYYIEPRCQMALAQNLDG
jgi:hypothetical protein